MDGKRQVPLIEAGFRSRLIVAVSMQLLPFGRMRRLRLSLLCCIFDPRLMRRCVVRGLRLRFVLRRGRWQRPGLRKRVGVVRLK